MKIFGFEIKKTSSKNESVEVSNGTYSDNNSDFGVPVYGQYWPIVTKRWDGEKTIGELGAVVRNIPDYMRLRLRAYDAYTKTDIIKTITSKYFNWVVGSGLKLQSEPNKTVLEMEGFKLPDNFQKNIEARFSLYANSIHCDFSKKKNLHELAFDFFQDSFIGGDNLCIARFEDSGLNFQFVSGEFIKNPPSNSSFFTDAKDKGNKILNGIEISDRGENVAFYICKKGNSFLEDDFERIESKIPDTNIEVAWMIYGQKLAPDHNRAIPAISQILEKVNKLDRYTEASVGKAEQAANIVYTIEHLEHSTGENPLNKIMDKKLGLNSAVVNGYDLSDSLSNRISEQTSNSTFNMPNGASLKAFGTSIETSYEQFYRAIFNGICASMDVPPEVALQMYNSNYSASRAAINGWGYIVDISREKLSNQFYKKAYKLWLYFEILNNKIQAPGFVKAMKSNDFMIVEAYCQSRFTGKNMPHIDPLKEVKATELMMNLELISREQATEDLGLGSWDENYQKILAENKKIVPKAEPVTTNTK